MPYFFPKPAVDDPVVRLRNWTIKQVAAKDMYFVGYDIHNRDVRVSTRIIELDVSTRSGMTASGRRYKLVGASATYGDSEWLWETALARRPGSKAWRDVSDEFIPGCRVSESGEPADAQQCMKSATGDSPCSEHER